MATQTRDETTTARRQSRAAQRNSTRNTIVAVAVVLALLVALFLFNSVFDKGPFGGKIDEGSFQAVILSNDKVYFGQLRDASGDFYELLNAYFVREAATADQTTQGQAPTQRQVLPIQNELHKPQNRMLIRKEEVVIVEDLASDSEILEAIREAESNN